MSRIGDVRGTELVRGHQSVQRAVAQAARAARVVSAYAAGSARASRTARAQHWRRHRERRGVGVGRWRRRAGAEAVSGLVEENSWVTN
jgi:hypothetical protein